MSIRKRLIVLAAALTAAALWSSWCSDEGAPLGAPSADDESWQSARDFMRSELGFDQEYRVRWMADNGEWPVPLDVERLRRALHAPELALEPADLAAIERVIEPLQARLRALGDAYLDRLDGALHEAFDSGRYEVRRVDESGGARFEPTRDAPLFSTTLGHAGWAIRLELRDAEVPDVAELKRELELARADRLEAVAAALRERAASSSAGR